MLVLMMIQYDSYFYCIYLKIDNSTKDIECVLAFEYNESLQSYGTFAKVGD